MVYRSISKGMRTQNTPSLHDCRRTHDWRQPQHDEFPVKLLFPTRVYDLQGRKGLILRRKQLQVQCTHVIIQEDDEVQLAVGSAYGERAAHIAMYEFQRKAGTRGGRQVRMTSVLANDAGLTSRELATGQSTPTQDLASSLTEASLAWPSLACQRSLEGDNFTKAETSSLPAEVGGQGGGVVLPQLKPMFFRKIAFLG